MLLYIVPEDLQVLQGRIKKIPLAGTGQKGLQLKKTSCLTRSLNCEPSPIAKAVLQLSTAVQTFNEMLVWCVVNGKT